MYIYIMYILYMYLHNIYVCVVCRGRGVGGGSRRCAGVRAWAEEQRMRLTFV